MKKITILNRDIEWTGTSIKYKAEPKHAEIIVEETGLSENSKALTSPCENGEAEESDSEALYEVQCRRFRRAAAQGNDLGQDRHDIQYAVKEACREMSQPFRGGMKKLKKIARYLAGVPEVMLEYAGDDEDMIHAYTDSDWAKCRETRGQQVVDSCASRDAQ